MATDPLHSEGFVLVEGASLVVKRFERQGLETQSCGSSNGVLRVVTGEIDAASFAPRNGIESAQPEGE